MTLPRETNDGRGSMPGVQDLYGELSQTSQFKVSLFLGDIYPTANSNKDLNAWLVTSGALGTNALSGNFTQLNSLRYEFMCSQTSIPGTSFSISEETGSRQGMVEKFANRRIFEDVSMTFYVDAEYGVLRLFEEWCNFINPLYSQRNFLTAANPRGQVGQTDENQFFRFRYPKSYKRDIAITKFERDFVIRGEGRDVVKTPSMTTYKFLNAFPTIVTAIPLSYDTSTITKVQVSFTYDRYVVFNHYGTGQNKYADDQTTKSGETIATASPSFGFGTSDQFDANFNPFGNPGTDINLAFTGGINL